MINKKLFLTNKYRTIIDMIRFESEDRFIYESIDRLKRENDDLSELIAISHVYGVTEQLNEYFNTFDDWLEDMYGY